MSERGLSAKLYREDWTCSDSGLRGRELGLSELSKVEVLVLFAGDELPQGLVKNLEALLRELHQLRFLFLNAHCTDRTAAALVASAQTQRERTQASPVPLCSLSWHTETRALHGLMTPEHDFARWLMRTLGSRWRIGPLAYEDEADWFEHYDCQMEAAFELAKSTFLNSHAHLQESRSGANTYKERANFFGPPGSDPRTCVGVPVWATSFKHRSVAKVSMHLEAYVTGYFISVLELHAHLLDFDRQLVLYRTTGREADWRTATAYVVGCFFCWTGYIFGHAACEGTEVCQQSKYMRAQLRENMGLDEAAVDDIGALLAILKGPAMLTFVAFKKRFHEQPAQFAPLCKFYDKLIADRSYRCLLCETLQAAHPRLL